MIPTTQKSASNLSRSAALALLAGTLTACQPAPSFSIAGSFFPGWIFCCLAGIALAVVVYRLFVGLKIESEVQPAVLIYPCIALSCALTLWLCFFG